MNTLVLSSSPNTDGLTAACARAAIEGIESAGASVREERLTEAGVGVCEQCGNGWGTCLKEHVCQVHDGFQRLHASCLEADALVLVTPVYWGSPSESMKAFLDRLRRCEAPRDDSALAGKPIVLVAAAGGSGGGVTTCLDELERFVRHVGARRVDLVGVTRWTREDKLTAIAAAARSLASAVGST